MLLSSTTAPPTALLLQLFAITSASLCWRWCSSETPTFSSAGPSRGEELFIVLVSPFIVAAPTPLSMRLGLIQFKTFGYKGSAQLAPYHSFFYYSDDAAAGQ